MRYIHFFGNSGYCGTDYHEFRIFNDDTQDMEINDLSYQFAHDNAETFTYLATGWDGDFESEEEEEQYYEDAYGNCGWEEIETETEEEFNNLEEMRS